MVETVVRGVSVMEWVAVVLAGVSLLVSSVTLLVATRILRTASRSELAGDERLEILREQQQRLDYLHEERRALLGTLELLRRETPPRRPSRPRNGAIPEDDDVEAYERAFASLRAFEQMNEAVELLLMGELPLGRGPEELNRVTLRKMTKGQGER